MLITSTKLVSKSAKNTTNLNYQSPLSSYSSASSTTTSSSSSNATSSSQKNDSVLNAKPLNQILNMKKSNNTNSQSVEPLTTKFEFKPWTLRAPLDNGSNSNNSNKNRLSLTSRINASMRNENQVNSWLHSTLKSKDGSNGKISKTFKVDTSKNKSFKKLNKEYLLNAEVLESFNLSEKERFRQLIAQNVTKKNVDVNNVPTLNASNLNASQNRNNLYQKYIRTSPTQTRDDIVPRPIISCNYTRRISLSSDAVAAVCNHAEIINGSVRAPNGSLYNIINTNQNINNKNNKTRSTNNITVIELDDSQSLPSLPGSVVKVAKKRPTSAQSNYYDENSDNAMESLKEETRQFYDKMHMPQINNNNNNYRKSGASLTGNSFLLNEKGRKWSEKLSEIDHVQDMIKKNTSNLLNDEERFMYKKRQRMEKERIEKELAEKFSHQLHLESNKLNIFEQEDAEIDEFPDFTDEQKECIKNAFIPNPPGEVLASGFALDITRRDIQTLKGTTWLNDEVINFYMNLIMERSSSSNSDNNNNKGNSYSNQSKVYAFSTFFYPKLIKDGYNSLRRWTKKVDLFTYNLVIVPIHSGVHWTLAVIDFDCKEIKYYDSMNGNNGECLNALRNYLKDEYADKKAGAQYDISSWNCLHVKDVPQQMNGSDCGMFACKYADFISRGKAICFNQSHMVYYRHRMVWEIVNKKMMQ